MELNNEIRRKKYLSALAVLKSFFYVRKVLGHFCNFQVFCRAVLSNDFSQTIADDQPDHYLQRCMNKVNITYRNLLFENGLI